MVAHGMAVAIVDELEVIEVDQGHAEPVPAGPCPLALGFQPCLQVLAVVEAGERIVLHQHFHLLQRGGQGLAVG